LPTIDLSLFSLSLLQARNPSPVVLSI
jgi:hypothetical protein